MNVVGLVVASGMCALPLAQSAAGPENRVGQERQANPGSLEVLDGTRWYLTVKPDEAASNAGERPFTDVLVFHKDKVVLTTCLAAGFKPSAIEVRPGEGRTGLVTEQSDPDGGKTRWEAVIRGKDISGSLVWTKPDGKAFNFTVAGKESTVLEGTTWTVRLDPEDGTSGPPVTALLVFRARQVEVREFPAGTFEPASYSLEPLRSPAGARTLTCNLSGAEDRTLSIDAGLEGKSLRGTAEFGFGEDQTVVYTLSGRLTRDTASVVDAD